jgi:hypothetical protein
MTNPSKFVASAPAAGAASESFAHSAITDGTNAQRTRPSGQSTSMRVRRHCHVRFSDEVQGILVSSLRDMLAEEKQRIWYSVSV